MGKFLFILFIVALIGGAYLVRQHFTALPLEESYIKADDISNPTIKKLEDAVQLNFELCQNTQQTIAVAFGSTTVRVVGKKGSTCEMHYGGQVENPNWDGKLTNTCLVPIDQGTQRFPLTAYGINFESISQYCSTK